MLTTDNNPDLMATTDIEFGGRTLCGCKPRYFNGRFMVLEYEYYGFTNGVIYIVAIVKYEPVYNERGFLPLAIFQLYQDAMAWVHRKEGRSHVAV